MNSIPPEKVHFLSQQELAKFRLEGTDPVEAEATAVKNAKHWGISVKEYYRRVAREDTVCPFPNISVPPQGAEDKELLSLQFKCIQDVLKGIR